MQIFLVGTALETAKCLDRRRLNKQIIEAQQIINAIEGKSEAWRKHPVTIMYENSLGFLRAYKSCLKAYKENRIQCANWFSDFCERTKPEFLENADWYLENMKNRLFTKNKEWYGKFFPNAKESFVNYYYVNNSWKKYEQH